MGKIKITKETVLDYLKTVVLIFIGNFILACGIMIFVSPMNFMTGGATGLALLMERVAGIPLSTTVAVLNVIVLSSVIFSWVNAFLPIPCLVPSCIQWRSVYWRAFLQYPL